MAFLGVGLLFAPAVHLLNDEGSRGLVSLFALPGSVLVGGLIGAGIAHQLDARSDGFFPPEFVGFLVGGTIGYTTWAIVDVVLFSEHEVPAERLSFLPLLAPVQGGGFVGGLAGRF